MAAGGGDGVADADDRLLRDARPVAANRREHGRADEGEPEADPVDDRRMRIASRDRQQDGDRRAQRRDLRERQIDEDDAAFDDVHAQVGVNTRQNETGDEGRRQKCQHCRVHGRPQFVWRADLLQCADQQVDVVVEQREVVSDFLHAADRGRHHQHLGAGRPADGVGRLQIEVRLDQHQLHVLPFHLVDQIERVLRRRRNARPWLDVADHVEPNRSAKLGNERW